MQNKPSSKYHHKNCDYCGKEYIGLGPLYCSVACANKKNRLQDVKQRFWSKVDITNLFDCWNWTNYKNHSGYGVLGINNKTILAHRLSYQFAFGQIKDNLQVLHKCNNPACVNPAHLYLGTNQDNVDYKVKNNRQSRLIGEKNPKTKLTEIQVHCIIELLDDNISQVEIAKQFSVTPTAISDIKRGKNWKHIAR
jgi:hypothetical protein